MIRTALVVIFCTWLGVMWGSITRDLKNADQRAADIRIMKWNANRCSIPWRPRERI